MGSLNRSESVGSFNPIEQINDSVDFNEKENTKSRAKLTFFGSRFFPKERNGKSRGA